MNANHPWRRPKNVSQASLLLVIFCVAISAIIVVWSVTIKVPLKDLQLNFDVYSIWRGYTGTTNHTIESVRIGLNLTVRNPSGSNSPPILFEEPSVLLNGWKLDIQRITCENGTSITTRVSGELIVAYIALCDTLQPIIVPPSQSVFLPLYVWIYNNTDNFPNAFYSPQGGSFNATLNGSLTVRPFYDPSVPAPQTQGLRSQAFWNSRGFTLTTTFTG